jgi:hypothetical protein
VERDWRGFAGLQRLDSCGKYSKSSKSPETDMLMNFS